MGWRGQRSEEKRETVRDRLTDVELVRSVARRPSRAASCAGNIGASGRIRIIATSRNHADFATFATSRLQCK